MLRLLILALTLLLGGLHPALAERRVAFVAGINDYPNLKPDRQLQRAVKDAETVGDTLQGLGFQVTRLTSGVTQEVFLRRFGEFVRGIEPGDTVLFFFAGHGIALDGANYLIPSDIPALSGGDERLVRSRSLAEVDLISDIRERGARVTVMVIDACRDNPFPRSGTRSLGATRGLAVKEPAEGVFSIYSAGFGQEALDRLPQADDQSPNSVFTRVFAEQLKKPGVNLIDLGETVKEEVAGLAKRANHPQVPAVYNQILGARQVFLAGLSPAAPDRTELPKPVVTLPAPAPAPPPPGPGPDEITWSVVQSTADARQIEDLIRRFPNSKLKPAWEARLADLKREAALQNVDKPDVRTSPKPSVGPGGGDAILLASFGEWGVYAVQKGRAKICYALSQPKDRQPKGIARDSAYVFVSFRPAESIRNEFATMTGVATKDRGEAEAIVGGATYALVTMGQNAWIRNPAEENQLVATMSRGQSLTLITSSKSGNKIIDRYSLDGFGPALDRARRECSG